MEFPTNHYSVYDELLFEDINNESFHTCFSDLYTEVKYNEDIKITSKFPKRLVGKFPVKIGNKKRLWTPMLISTSAPRSVICQETVKRFLSDDNMVTGPLAIQVGRLSTQAYVPSDNDIQDATTKPDSNLLIERNSTTHYNIIHINILGMDILERIFPQWPYSLAAELTSGLRPATEEIRVRIMREEDAFAMYTDNYSIDTVFKAIAMVLGPEYTNEQQAKDISILYNEYIYTVGALRALSEEHFNKLTLPLVIRDLLRRAR